MQRSSLDQRAFDVIVCGAGSAGAAAAWAAACAGAKTLLLERLGFSGGTPVAAMIHTLDAIVSCQDYSQVVVGGYARALIAEIESLGGRATGDNPGEAISIHPEIMKIATDRLLQGAGVQTIYRSTVIGAVMESKTIRGVEAHLRDGRAVFHAHCVVDGTGDAEIAAMAGAPWLLDPELQAITYHFRLGNVEAGVTWQELENKARWAMDRAAARGRILRYGGPWVIRLADGEVSINATRVYANPLDPEAMSQAEREARESMLTIWQILRDEVPALRNSYILSGATDLHVRESRKVQGDYVLTEEDIQTRREFPDAIALGAWPIDIHPTNGFVGVHPHKESPPPPYQIPYRCLLPQDIDGLLVAGRPISTTHRAHGSTRVPGTSMATGHAAGVAAALAALGGKTPREVNSEQIRQKLLQQNAILSIEATETR